MAASGQTSNKPPTTQPYVAPTVPAAQSGAWAALRSMLRSYNLEELTDWAFKQFTDGRSLDEIQLGLEDQPVFKQKYSAIFERRAKGLPPVSVQDIVNYQKQAAEIEHIYGVPAGFVDVNRAIVSDLSINELQQRAQDAADAAAHFPELSQQLDAWGLHGPGALTAMFMDPDTAYPKIQQQFQAAKFSVLAQRAGYGSLSQDEANKLVTAGVTDAQVQSGLGALSGELSQTLVGGQTGIDRATAIDALAGNEPAKRKVDQVVSERIAPFKSGGAFAESQQGITGLGAAR